jgi:hypothetical protein
VHQTLALKESGDERNHSGHIWLCFFHCHQKDVAIGHRKNQGLQILKIKMHVPELSKLWRVPVK